MGRNIVELKGAYEDRHSVNLVMELCAGGELFDRIIAKGHYSERAAANLCRQMVTVVHNCHSMGVIHRDLKPENFLFLNNDENSPLKATDFGLSVFYKAGNCDPYVKAAFDDSGLLQTLLRHIHMCILGLGSRGLNHLIGVQMFLLGGVTSISEILELMELNNVIHMLVQEIRLRILLEVLIMLLLKYCVEIMVPNVIYGVLE